MHMHTNLHTDAYVHTCRHTYMYDVLCWYRDIADKGKQYCESKVYFSSYQSLISYLLFPWSPACLTQVPKVVQACLHSLSTPGGLPLYPWSPSVSFPCNRATYSSPAAYSRKIKSLRWQSFGNKLATSKVDPGIQEMEERPPALPVREKAKQRMSQSQHSGSKAT